MHQHTQTKLIATDDRFLVLCKCGEEFTEDEFVDYMNWLDQDQQENEATGN